MKLLKLLAAFIVLFCCGGVLLAQDSTETSNSSSLESKLPQGLTLMNQLKYSTDYKEKIDIFEDWLNMDYRTGMFSAGLRLVSFQPKDPTVSGTKRRNSEVDFKYFKVETGDADEGAEIVAGNYYAMFGRGLILKSYEDRNIRIDNNLLGVKVTGRYSGFTLTALSGMPENLDGDRKDVIYAADLEYSGFAPLKAGFTFAANKPDQDGAAETRLTSFRIQPKIWNFDFYGEYGVKQNDDDKLKYFNNSESIVGKGAYGSVNFYYDSFSILGEYKYYDNFLFASSDNSVTYNTPPATRKDYSYILLNRHPSPLNQDNEQGFQVEVNYTINEGIFLSANYGLTKTLSGESYYQRIHLTDVAERTQLKESFVQGTFTWNKSFTTIAGFAYNEELATNTKNLTPVLETRYYFGDVNTLRLVLEHQQTTVFSTQEKYYTDVATFEYLRSPKFSASLVGEIDTKENTPGNIDRKYFGFIQFGYNFFDNTDVTLLFGSRQAGAICIGGVCRYEPKFDGVEFKMLTRI